LIADAYRGLLRVAADRRVEVLADHVNGSPIRFANAVCAASDGRVFLSDSSQRFGAEEWGGTFTASIIDIMEGRATGRVLVFDPKTRETSIVMDGLAVHATTVPETFWPALRSGSLQDGSLARFLIFRSTDDIPDRNRSPKALSDVPAALVDALQAVSRGVPGFASGNLADTGAPTARPEPYPVPMAPDAEQLFDELDRDITDRQRRSLDCGHGAVLARVWENTAKVALIKAVSADPARPVIRLEDATWARNVVAFCVETLLTQAERHIAENDIERSSKRVQEIIRAAGPRGITKKRLYDKTRFLTKRDREDILTTLIESEEIGVTVHQSPPPPIARFPDARRRDDREKREKAKARFAFLSLFSRVPSH
jgi:Strictosidine synthase/Protein of unknown function (DUF3987)